MCWGARRPHFMGLGQIPCEQKWVHAKAQRTRTLNFRMDQSCVLCHPRDKGAIAATTSPEHDWSAGVIQCSPSSSMWRSERESHPMDRHGHNPDSVAAPPRPAKVAIDH